MELTKEQIDEALKGTDYEGGTFDNTAYFEFTTTGDEGPRKAFMALKRDACENAARAIILQRKLDATELKVDRAIQAAKDLASLFSEAHTSRVSYASIVEGLARVTRALAEIKG